MGSHCPGCSRPQEYDSTQQFTIPDPSCPGCQACERLHAELLSVRESLLRERAGQVKCNAGHVSDRALWDCPVCVEAMRTRLVIAERVVAAVREWILLQRDVDEALAAWEEAHG